MIVIGQRGIERTGTTMAAKMVQQAFGVSGLCGRRVKPPKHAELTGDEWPAGTALMINIKDPYSWMVSWHAWTQQARYSGRKIPKRKVPVEFSRDGMATTISKFNRKYKNWMTAGYKFAVIRYEDILMAPAVLYEKIAKLLNMKPDPAQIWAATPPQIVRPARTRMGGLPPIKFDRAYYTEKKYLDLLQPWQIAQITEDIDWKLLEGLYEPIM